MSLVYLISWLPLGILGTLSDANIYIFGNDTETTSIIFMSCHLIGMASAFVNPIIYGFRDKYVREGNITKYINIFWHTYLN